jgi:hypothetical protein
MNNIRFVSSVAAGSKWSALVPQPYGSDLSQGQHVTVNHFFTNGTLNFSDIDGNSWHGNLQTWKQYFEPALGYFDYPDIDDTGNIVDNVNSPSHYGQGKIEAIEYISDFLTKEEYQGYLRGNIAKYLHRFPYKNGIEDLRKAQWYLERLIQEVE